MTINFTLIIQFINFIIAYFIIKKILLKPAIHLIQHDEKIKNELLQLFQATTTEISNKEKYKSTRWNQLKRIFNEKKPKLEKSPPKFNWFIPKYDQVSQKVLDDLNESISNIVINGIKNVKQ